MSNSKKLPTIEVGDTVVFKTEHSSKQDKHIVSFVDGEEEVIKIKNNDHFYLIDFVAEVIKPTKERAYSEEEMKQCWEQAFNQGMNLSDEDYEVVLFKDFIQSLNK